MVEISKPAHFEMIRGPSSPNASALADDVRHGLAQRPRSIPPKWFYDAVGSALFDRICDLPEYYLTRSERGLLERVAPQIISQSRPLELIELGSGMARKTGFLIAAMAHSLSGTSPRYVPFDISPEALETSARDMIEAFPAVQVHPIVGDFEHDLARIRLADVGRAPPPPRLFAFLGSTIGNLDEQQAPALMASIAAQMNAADYFVLGVDLVKDTSVLERAYDDSAGVTAAFNKNVLAVINRELGANFDLDRWVHEARYDVDRARIEMHLRSVGGQRVQLPAIELEVAFDDGERILTEISRKFTRASAEATLSAGNLRMEAWYPASDDSFALALSRRA